MPKKPVRIKIVKRGNLNGVEGFVDFNVFRGDINDLNEILYRGLLP